MLLTTVLPPILRRARPGVVARPGAAVAVRAGVPAGEPHGRELSLQAEVLVAVDRIVMLNADPGNRAAEIRRECERLRALASRHPS